MEYIMNMNENDLQKNQVEVNLNATLTLLHSPSKSKCCRCSTQGPHPENSLKLAGEILLKLAADQYSQSETPGAWELIKALLNSSFNNKGIHRER